MHSILLCYICGKIRPRCANTIWGRIFLFPVMDISIIPNICLCQCHFLISSNRRSNSSSKLPILFFPYFPSKIVFITPCTLLFWNRGGKYCTKLTLSYIPKSSVWKLLSARYVSRSVGAWWSSSATANGLLPEPHKLQGKSDTIDSTIFAVP